MEKQSVEKCIWMEAGVLEYQLCQMHFDCDNCEVQRSIQNPVPTGPAKPDQAAKLVPIILKPPPENAFLPGLQYYSNHLWINRVGKDLVVLGLDDFFLNLWGSKIRIIFQNIDTLVAANTSVAWLITEAGIINLKLPFTGLVLAGNPSLGPDGLVDPDLHIEQPLKMRWLLKIKTTGDDLVRDQWLTREQYIQQLFEDTRTINALIDRDYQARSLPLPDLENNLKKRAGESYSVTLPTIREIVAKLSRDTHRFY